MPLILSLETATTVCSVCLARDGKILSLREVNAGYSHSENITVFIQEVCKDAKIDLHDLDAVAVSKGPGSYTGLRIGASTAKGLCYAMKKPLIAIDTLKALANCYLISNKPDPGVVLIPMLDARRMEVYCSAYNTSLIELSPVSAVIIDANSYQALIKNQTVVLFGDGSSKCKPLFENHPHVIFAGIDLSSTGMASLAEEKFLQKDFEDVSLFEPFYLKEAMVGKPGG